MPAANEAMKARSRGMDSDTLYDVPDVTLSTVPAPKRGRQFSMKPARPKKTIATMPLHPLPKANETESWQLSTPPDSKKRSAKRSRTQMELFSSASITKPILSSMRLITTEDALKSKIASLGQTTMERFAASRFQPAAQALSDDEANGMTGSLERVLTESGVTHGPRPDTASHEGDTINHFFHDHETARQNKVEFDPLLDDGDLIGYNEDRADLEFEKSTPICCDREDPYRVLDEGDVLEQGGNVIVLDKGKIGTEMSKTRRGDFLVAWPESEDDFPLDDDIKVEMAYLSMPDKMRRDCCPRSVLRSLQNKNVQSTGTGSTNSQPSIAASYKPIGNHDKILNIGVDTDSSMDFITYQGTVPRSAGETIDPPPLHGEEHDGMSAREERRLGSVSYPANYAKTILLAERNDYLPLEPFARPPFPSKVRDRSLISGVSSKAILRTCFRIGEALREGTRCEGLEQDAIIELFARVRDSSSDISRPSKLYYEFSDLFHDRPPFIRGTLENNKISGLQEAESRMLLGIDGSGPMTRCLGRLKRIISGPPGWMLYIINIRPTDWEEVRWTRQIAGAGMAK